MELDMESSRTVASPPARVIGLAVNARGFAASSGGLVSETSSARERPTAATALLLPYNGSTANIDNGRALAQAIVDTIREPLLVLDKDLHVVTASRSFYLKFKMNRQGVQGRPVYALGEGQWNIPALRFLLENIASQHTVMEDYEVERDFTGIGRRTMLLRVAQTESGHCRPTLQNTRSSFSSRAVNRPVSRDPRSARQPQGRPIYLPNPRRAVSWSANHAL
jgi:hypothetical protein